MVGIERGTASGILRRGLVAVAVTVALTMVACGEGGDPAPAERTVSIETFTFVPERLVVEAGSRVTWRNGDDILHTVTTGSPGEQGVPGVSDDTPPRPDGLVDGELDGRGAQLSFRFPDAGTYRYFCSIHAGMSGTVIVR